MAKKQPEPTNALTKTEHPGALMELNDELPDWMEASTAGTEGISASEVKLPRLSIAQGLSPQMSPDNAQFIDNLRLGDLFNDLTGEVYGRGPIHFMCIRRDVRRIEFKPRSEGGGVVDMDVPPNDPRCEWTTDDDGKRVPPLATKFSEWVIWLCKPDGTVEPLVLSIKDTNKSNRRAADRLTTFNKAWAKGRPIPIYGKVYTVGVSMDKNDKGTFGVYVVNPAGFPPQALFEKAKQFHESLEGKIIQTTREPGADDGDTTFNPDEM